MLEPAWSLLLQSLIWSLRQWVLDWSPETGVADAGLKPKYTGADLQAWFKRLNTAPGASVASLGSKYTGVVLEPRSVGVSSALGSSGPNLDFDLIEDAAVGTRLEGEGGTTGSFQALERLEGSVQCYKGGAYIHRSRLGSWVHVGWLDY